MLRSKVDAATFAAVRRSKFPLLAVCGGAAALAHDSNMKLYHIEGKKSKKRHRNVNKKTPVYRPTKNEAKTARIGKVLKDANKYDDDGMKLTHTHWFSVSLDKTKHDFSVDQDKVHKDWKVELVDKERDSNTNIIVEGISNTGKDQGWALGIFTHPEFEFEEKVFTPIVQLVFDRFSMAQSTFKAKTKDLLPAKNKKAEAELKTWMKKYWLPLWTQVENKQNSGYCKAEGDELAIVQRMKAFAQGTE